jgi:hypothetical protein
MAKNFWENDAVAKSDNAWWSNDPVAGKKKEEPIPERSWSEVPTDLAASAISGLGGLAQFPGQIYGLATGAIKEPDFAKTGLYGIGQEMQDYAKANKSQALLAKEAAVEAKTKEAAQKEGELGAFKTSFLETVKDPALLSSFLVEQVPQAIPSLVAALIPGIGPEAAAEIKSLQLAAKAATNDVVKKAAEQALATAINKGKQDVIERGATAAVRTAAVQQGADVGAGTYDAMYKYLTETKRMSPEQAADETINYARAAGLGGAGLSLLAQKLPGAKAFERALAGERTGMGRLTGAVIGAAKEAPGENVEEVGGRLLQNIAMKQVNPEQSLTEGLGQTAAQATIGAGGLGALGGIRSGRPITEAPAVPEAEKIVEPEKKPLALGVSEPFTPRVFPDGSVATTPEDIKRYEEEQFRKKYEAQPADERPPLALGLSEPFTPVALPDGSVALTKSDLDAYEQEQFEKKYAAQPNLNQAKVSEVPPQLGYSPLPGVPKITSEGVVLLNPEQEFQAKYAPQVKRITAEEWSALSPEEKDAASVKAQLEERQRIEDAAAEAAGKPKKEAGFKGKWTPEERAALGIQEAPKPVKPADRASNPENIGIDNQLISEGAAPFSDRSQAVAAAKLQPTLKPLKLEKNQGYVLTPKTQEELDREAEVARNRAVVNVGGKAGEPLGAGQYIARYGGLSMDTMSDMNSGGNYKHGMAYMFSPTGMSFEQAKERLVSAGYLPEEASHSEVIDAIKKNALSAEGEETSAERETKTQNKAFELKEAAENLKSPVAEEMGYPVTPQEIAQNHLDKAADLGIDTSAITEQAFEETRGQPEDAYHDRVSELTRDAIKNSETDVLPALSQDGTHYVTTAENIRVEKELTGKTMAQVAKWAVDNAPNAFAKHFAKKAYEKIREMERSGVRFGFDIATGNRRSSELEFANGVTNFYFGRRAKGEDTTINIKLNGATNAKQQTNFPPGCTYTIVLHELLHVATRGQLRFLSGSNPIVKELRALYEVVSANVLKEKKAGTLPEIGKMFFQNRNNAFATPDELVSWGLTDERMQKYLTDIKVGDKTVFSKLIDLVRQVLGIAKPFETALDRLVRTADQIIDISIEDTRDGAHLEGYNFGPGKIRATSGAQQSLFSKAVRETLAAKQGVIPASSGQQALDTLTRMGRQAEKPTESYLQKARKSWDNALDNPKTTKDAAIAAIKRFNDRVQTWSFSSDAALNNRIREEIMSSDKDSADKIGTLLNVSLSQTVHADALASLLMTEGNLRYDENLHKWVAVKDDANFVTLSKGLDELAKNHGLNKEMADTIAHTAFEARRLKSMVSFNLQVEQEVAAMRAEAANLRKRGSPVAASALFEKATNRLKDKKFIHMTDAQINEGNSLFKLMPELDKISGVWNQMRENTANILVETGLWSKEEAEFLLDNADYVPFFREEQIEEGKGPKEYIRGLMVQAKEKKLTGSAKPVNDVFDNMARWMQYSVNRAVRNRSALALTDTAVDSGMAKKIAKRAEGDNVVRVWRNGKEEFYSMADPMFVEAFTGLESIAIPTWKWASKLSDMLRQSVVMYPLFSVAQLPQDSFAAMFSSGLKAQYALRIPALAAKEFLRTLTKTSKTHEELKSFGVVGVRDFTSAMARLDAEVYAGLKAPPGFGGKLKGFLSHIAMASDNAVRQATYEAAMSQGMSRGEAIEKAFEIWNVRRKGTSKSLAIAGQVIPFFSAYLAAQNVALKTISGAGTSPTERSEAIKTLAGTTASVMVLSLLYAMMNGDDDDYLKKPAVVRDRLLMIPGTGGLSIPIRSDLFSVPKIVTEHMYLMMTDKGYEDGRKFRDSMAAVLKSALFSPTVVPQAFKPLVEIGINYDFYSGRPLIGHFEKMKETERQFTDTTSELAKLMGSTGIMSPIAIDHILRGMFGSAGGLAVYITNPLLHSDPNIDRPTMSWKDAAAALPGTSGFVSREYESGLKNDFYVLRDEVAKVANTMSDLKQKNPEQIEKYLSSEEIMARYGLSKSVSKITEQLGKIRKNISQITNAPRNVMTADEKQATIKELRAVELDMLKAINTKELRAMAKL